MQEHAVIVAGGKGSRMNSAVSKQFMVLHGIPVLMHTLKAFFDYSPRLNIILVLPKEEIPVWHDLTDRFGFSYPLTLTPGGTTRFRSVKNGLDAIAADEGLVAIHDGVRPLISKDIIGASYRLAAVHGSAVAAVRLKESIRITDQDTTKAVDRSDYRLIQTPQTFDLCLIRKAYNIEEEASFTDDAGVAEKSGHKISLFEGSYKNIKITTPEDLVIAEALMRI